MRFVLLLFVALWAAAPLAAESIFFRNRAYKGPCAGRGPSLTVGLKEIVQAFELPLSEVNGGYSVGTASEPTAGQVLVNGIAVTATAEADGIQVNLKEFCEAAGLLYKPNRDLGSIDVALAPQGKPGQVAVPVAGVGGTVTVYNQKTPGQMLDAASLIPTGVTTFLLAYRDGYSDAAYRSYFTKVDRAARLPEVAVVKLNVGPSTSELARKLNMSNSPRLYLFSSNRRLWLVYNGHSMEAIVNNPELGVQQLQERVKNPNAGWFRFP